MHISSSNEYFIDKTISGEEDSFFAKNTILQIFKAYLAVKVVSDYLRKISRNIPQTIFKKCLLVT